MPQEADTHSKPPLKILPRLMRLPGITPLNTARAARNTDTIPGNRYEHYFSGARMPAAATVPSKAGKRSAFAGRIARLEPVKRIELR